MLASEFLQRKQRFTFLLSFFLSFFLIVFYFGSPYSQLLLMLVYIRSGTKLINFFYFIEKLLPLLGLAWMISHATFATRIRMDLHHPLYFLTYFF